MQQNRVQRFALAATRWIGSPSSIVAHTLFFGACFVAVWTRAVGLNEMLLGLTTLVSLEAIYLALFIQMTVNAQGQSLAEVEKDIDEMQEDVEEIQEDVEEIQEDVDELQEDVEDISEDVEEITEEEQQEEQQKAEQQKTLADIQTDLRKLMQDIEKLQGR